MPVFASSLNNASLEQHLTPMLVPERHNGETVKILSRIPSDHKGTFKADLLTVLLPDGSGRHLLCKYAVIGSKRHSAISYEACMYLHIVSRVTLTKVHCYGSFQAAGESGTETWLVLDYLEESNVVDPSRPGALVNAARWIAAFHQQSETLHAFGIRKFDRAYYLSQADAISILAHQLGEGFEWLTELCQWFKQRIDILAAAPRSLIHGEYYDKNILMRRGEIFPVDWEKTALGTGEIDVAALLDRKDEATARNIIDAYIDERWQNDATSASLFLDRLEMARLYLLFHWPVEWQLPASEFRRWMGSQKYGGQLKRFAILAGIRHHLIPE